MDTVISEPIFTDVTSVQDSQKYTLVDSDEKSSVEFINTFVSSYVHYNHVEDQIGYRACKKKNDIVDSNSTEESEYSRCYHYGHPCLSPDLHFAREEMHNFSYPLLGTGNFSQCYYLIRKKILPLSTSLSEIKFLQVC